MSLKLSQVHFRDLSKTSIDNFIIALGHEHRASHLASVLRDYNIETKICVELVDDLNKDEKIKIEELGFTFVSRSDFQNFLKNLKGGILVDYSVMMKSLYSDILSAFLKSKYRNSSELLFSYSHAVFEKALDKAHFVESTKPILLTESKNINQISKPKLIISLGYERLSAIGVIENLEIDYEDVIVLINKTGTNTDHYNECLRNNESFLEMLNPSQILELNFFNFAELSSIFDSIVYRLYQEGEKAIIAPLSVKTFSLFAMVQSLNHDHIVFYNVTSINKKPYYQKEPILDKDPLLYRVVSND